MGAFYVDQKKKGLLPSTLPSEHEQWGLLAEEQWVYPPLTPPNELLCVVAIHETASNTTTPLANELGTVRFKIHNDFSSGNDGTNKARCIIVCR